MDVATAPLCFGPVAQAEESDAGTWTDLANSLENSTMAGVSMLNMIVGLAQEVRVRGNLRSPFYLAIRRAILWRQRLGRFRFMIAPHGIEYTVYELNGFFPRKAPCQFNGFVDQHRRWSICMEQFENRQT